MSEITIKNNAEEGMEQYFFRASAEDFKKIPGSPIAYWANKNIFTVFEINHPISSITTLHRGISTGNTELFARSWHEVSVSNLCLISGSRVEAKLSGKRWFPYNRGGAFRKWYGLGIDVLDYEDNGCRMINAAEIGDSPGFRHDGAAEYFIPTITWTALTSGKPSFRFLEGGYILGHKGSSIKAIERNRFSLLGLFNSNSIECFLEYLSPTLDINISQISALPLPEGSRFTQVSAVVNALTDISKNDWDSYETSWNFKSLSFLSDKQWSVSRSHAPAWEYRPDFDNNSVRVPTQEHGNQSLAIRYTNLRTHWQKMTEEMQHLEEENNRIFIEAYGLQDELTPEVPLKEITLTCNPHYRYSGKKSEEELEILLLADTLKEFISYAVGCMFGRYALEKPGLILANQGETLEDYLKQVPEPSFSADDDNVIPVLDDNWFSDDITQRFCAFLRVTFGEAHYEESLKFIEQAIGKNIRGYFLKSFYTDHVKRYKKRPIYWLFSSGKHKAFECLIYLHRYNTSTLARMRTEYVIPLTSKFNSHIEKLEQDREVTESAAEVKKIEKELQTLHKKPACVKVPVA